MKQQQQCTSPSHTTRPAERPLLFSGCFRGHIYIHDLSRSLKRAERAWSVPACSMMIPRLPTRLSRLFFFSLLPIGSRRRTILFAKCSMCPRACIQAGPANQDNGGSAPNFRQHPPSPRSTVSTASLRTTFTSGSTSCDAQFSSIRPESFLLRSRLRGNSFRV